MSDEEIREQRWADFRQRIQIRLTEKRLEREARELEHKAWLEANRDRLLAEEAARDADWQRIRVTMTPDQQSRIHSMAHYLDEMITEMDKHVTWWPEEWGYDDDN